MDDSFLTRLAVGLLGRDRAEALPPAGINDRAWRVARHALGAAKLTDTVAFFLDDMVVMHYGTTFAASHSTVSSRLTGERIKGVNEVVSTTASSEIWRPLPRGPSASWSLRIQLQFLEPVILPRAIGGTR